MSGFQGQGEQVPSYIKEAIEKEQDEEEKETKENKELREFQEKAMELLKKYGIVEQKEGYTIVDTEELENFSNNLISGKPSKHSYKVNADYKKIKEAVGYNDKNPSKEKEEKLEEAKYLLKNIGHNYYDFFEGEARHFLLSAFEDKEVVTKQDFEEGEIEEKPLFYHPESKEDAFDKEKIKNADFHMGPWEVSTQLGTEEYSPFIEDLDYTEASLAALIYNKNYGDGERVGGTIMVRAVDYDTREFLDERQKISQKWFEYGNKTLGTNIKRTNFASRPHQVLREGLYEDLQENNLLKPADFETKSSSETVEKYGLFKTITDKKGHITLEDNVRYCVGSKYGGGAYGVASMGKDSYGIIKLSEGGEPEKIEELVDKVDPDKVELKDDAGKLKRIGKRKLDKLGYIHELSEEDEWSDINISEFLEIKREVVKDTDVSLEELSKEELSSFLGFYKNKKENQPKELEDVYDFVKTYGTYGLRSFASLESNESSGEDLIDIMKKTETRADAIPVFRRYTEIIDKVDDLEEEIELFFKQEKDKDIDIGRIQFEIKDRANEVLEKGLKSEDKNYEEIEAELEGLNEEIVTFTSIFKTAFKGEEEIDFESVRGLDFETQKVDEISEEDKEEMVEISEDNWKGKETGKDVYEKLEEELKEETADGDFHILKKDNKVVAFVRMKPPEDGHKKATSLNVKSGYRGSAIGEAMLKNTLAEEAEDYIIDATVFPELRVGTKYIEDFDFNIVGTTIHGEEGKKIFEIQINKDKNKELKTKNSENWTYEKITEKYKDFFEDKDLKQLKEASEEIIIIKYDVEKEDSQMMLEVEELTGSVYEVTRYFSEEESEKNGKEKNESVRYFVFEKVD